MRRPRKPPSAESSLSYWRSSFAGLSSQSITDHTEANYQKETTMQEAMTKLLPPVPSDAELAKLQADAEATRKAAQDARAHLAQLDERIEAAKANLNVDQTLAQTAAELAAQQIEHDITGTALAKDHAKALFEAKTAASSAEQARLEAQALVPVLEAMRGRLAREADELHLAATKAGTAYGSGLAAIEINQKYAPRLASLLESEFKIRAIENEWGSRWYVEVRFRAPVGGDSWSGRDLALAESAQPLRVEPD